MILNLDLLTTLEFHFAIFFALADHEVNFDEALVVDNVERGLVENGLAGGFFAVVEVIAKELGKGFEIFEIEGEDNINVLVIRG